MDIVLGAQFGDEGKGRIINHLCNSGEYEICARFNGSDNAGHTAVLESGETFAFRQIPVGAAYGMKCIIGRGCMLDLDNLESEIIAIEKLRGDWTLYVDSRCHIKVPEHRSRDLQEEEDRSEPIGTTHSGNGPAYSDKYARKTKRLCDIDITKYPNVLRRVAPVDTSLLLSGDYPVLVEGAHGIMLDIDHGTYPFVTSSGCTAGAACHSLGVSPNKVNRVIGVIKPYITRVGAGAMPTEIQDLEMASRIRETGHEYGTNTKRPRRIGWLDLQALAYAVRVGGITELVLAKIDIINTLGLDQGLMVCTGYKDIAHGYIPPRDASAMGVSPIYIEVDSIVLIDLIEMVTKVPVTMISSGTDEGSVKSRIIT